MTEFDNLIDNFNAGACNISPERQKAIKWKEQLEQDKFLADCKDTFAQSNRAWEVVKSSESSLKAYCEDNNIDYDRL